MHLRSHIVTKTDLQHGGGIVIDARAIMQMLVVVELHMMMVGMVRVASLIVMQCGNRGRSWC